MKRHMDLPSQSSIRLPRTALSVILILADVFAVYLAVVAPRPFSVYETDIEADYYWNAQRIHAGLPVLGLYHPGTPVYYLSAALLRLRGSDLEKAQGFFLAGRTLQALLVAPVLCAFVLLVLRDVAGGVRALALATLLAWPSFFSSLDYFGSTFFATAGTLISLAFFWRYLQQPERARELAFTGLALGAALAAKMSAGPVAVAMVSALVSAAVLRQLASRREKNSPSVGMGLVREMVLLGATAGTMFVVLTLPVIKRFPVVIATAASRLDAAAVPASIASFRGLLHDLLLYNPLFSVLLLVVVAVFLIVLPGSISRVWRSPSPEAWAALREGLLCAWLLAAFGYALYACSVDVVPNGDPGVLLRNVGPTALCIPFLLLFLWSASAGTRAFLAKDAVKTAAIAIAISAVALSLGANHRMRRAMMQRVTESATAEQQALAALHVQTGGRVAVDTSSMPLGDMGFCLWGNGQYGGGVRDAELLKKYRPYVYFRFRETVLSAVPLVVAQPGLIGRLKSWRRRYLPSLTHDPLQPTGGTLIAGEGQDSNLGAIAYPQWEWGRWSDGQRALLHQEIVKRWGEPTVRLQKVGGTDWVFLTGLKTQSEGTLAQEKR